MASLPLSSTRAPSPLMGCENMWTQNLLKKMELCGLKYLKSEKESYESSNLFHFPMSYRPLITFLLNHSMIITDMAVGNSI